MLAIPLSTVERAGTGDLLTRTSRDVDALSHSVRFAVPETLIAVVTIVLTVGALVLVGPLLALPLPGRACRCCRLAPGGTCAGPPTATCARTRRTPRSPTGSPRRSRAPARSRRCGGSGSASQRTDDDIAPVVRRRALHAVPADGLSSRSSRSATSLPVVGDAALRRLVLHSRAGSTLGQVTAAALYVQQLIDPVDRLLVLAGRAAGRRRVAGPAARRRRGAATTGRRPASRRRPATAGRRTRRAVRVRRRAATCCTAST